MNVHKLPSRWLIIAGACLAFLGFFLPCVKISSSAELLGIGFSQSSTESFADGGGYLYFIPLSFIGTIVLNYIFHSPNTRSNQRNVLYILEWVTTGFGILLSLYIILRLNNTVSEIFESYDTMMGDLGSGSAQATPTTGIFLMLFGATLMVYGLIGDRIILPPPPPPPPPTINNYDDYDNRQYHHGIDERNRSSRASFENGEFSPSEDNNGPVINAPVVVAPPISNQQQKRKISAWLVSRDGKNFQLNTGETTIGRSSDNDIQLSNPRISKHHAKIVEMNQHYKIVDLGSTNGTWLNGKLVRQPTALQTEDEIRFGDTYKVQFVSVSK